MIFHFSSIALSLWVFSNLLLMAVPHYGAYLFTLTGMKLLFCNFLYFNLLPKSPLVIRLEQSVLILSLGWCFWLVMAAGCLSVLIGGAVSLLDLAYPHSFSTILQLDYETPFNMQARIRESGVMEMKTRRTLCETHLPLIPQHFL